MLDIRAPADTRDLGLDDPVGAMRSALMGKVREPASELEIERGLMNAIAAVWREANETYFRKSLRVPTFELVPNTSILGRWLTEFRTLQLSRKFVLEQPWSSVTEVIKHEMAHQYVDEVLGYREERAHGPVFQRVCREIGVDGSAAGIPAANAIDQETSKVMEKVQRLLALAESPNENEAEAAMAAARKLMLKYNIDHTETVDRNYAFKHLGEPATRTFEWMRWLASILDKHFFVSVIWVNVYLPDRLKWGHVLEVMGTQPNLEMAAYVHAYLTQTVERLWRDHKKAHGIKQNRDRLEYFSGVMHGFRNKLDAAKTNDKREGLIWVGDIGLDEFFSNRHPRIRTTNYGGGQRGAAFAHGQAAGKDIVISRPVSSGSVSRGLALPARTK